MIFDCRNIAITIGLLLGTTVVAFRDDAPVPSVATLGRPKIVTDALSQEKPIYYFGLGSNMLRSKVENRGLNGSKIELLEMKAAVVPDYRLAFNMKGFPPLEPGMGSLEPIEKISKNRKSLPQQRSYGKPECHGALMLLTPENYEKVMASEGVVNPNNKNNKFQSSYEEIVVTAIPYDSTKPPVQAIALRARPHVRLKSDPLPSERYMTMLREGALELGLQSCYRDFLTNHPVQQTPKWLKNLALKNLIATVIITFQLKWRGLSKLQSLILFSCYVPSTAHPLLQILSNLLNAIVLFPGAVVGIIIQAHLRKKGKNFPPFLKSFLEALDDSTTKKNQ